MTFADLELIPSIQKALREEGYTEPTPIQAQAIPFVLAGRDLLGVAQTGTGKTAAFAIPIIQGLATNADRNAQKPAVRALIITPTRELAIQIGESLRAYGRHTDLRSTVIFGGVKAGKQIDRLRHGIDILVATPGRLLDLMGQGYIKLNQLEYFVLDEADRMLDMGFIHDVRKIIAKLPAKRQTLFFSATMPAEIQELSGRILDRPKQVEVTPVSSSAEMVEQAVYHVTKKDKRPLLIHLLKHDDIDLALVFTRTKHGADRVAKSLHQAGIKADAIHGNKSQNARQRALEDFKNRKTRVLVATDIAARGIDIDDLSHVINYDLPNVAETYVHRIGRTGRAGASGMALSFCDNEEKAYLRDINKLTRQRSAIIEDHPYPMTDAGIAEQERKTADNLAHREAERAAWKARKKAGSRR